MIRALLTVLLFWPAVFIGVSACAERHRPGDFAPDQLHWIQRNLK